MSVGNPSLTTEALGETTWFGTQGLCRTETVRAARLEMELIRPRRGGLKERFPRGTISSTTGS